MNHIIFQKNYYEPTFKNKAVPFSRRKIQIYMIHKILVSFSKIYPPKIWIMNILWNL